MACKRPGGKPTWLTGKKKDALYCALLSLVTSVYWVHCSQGMPLTSTWPGTNTVSVLLTLKRRKAAVDNSVMLSSPVKRAVAKSGVGLHRRPHCVKSPSCPFAYALPRPLVWYKGENHTEEWLDSVVTPLIWLQWHLISSLFTHTLPAGFCRVSSTADCPLSAVNMLKYSHGHAD